jgi:hypothetical protein
VDFIFEAIVMNTILRISLASLALVAATLGPRTVHADAGAPSQKQERRRVCCPLASHLPLHLGSAHLPVEIRIVGSAQSLGHHSYSGDAAHLEANGIIYTRRGGFIDTGHLRGMADLAARLTVQLRPLLARGEGVLRLRPRDGEMVVRVKSRLPDDAIAHTSALLAMRIAFQVSIWAEITQHYGHSVVRGAEEYFSSFTPEDLYSNLLGAHLGAASVESPLPYDRAMDVFLASALRSLEAVPSSETRRILDALRGRWWRADTPWRSPAIPIVHSFDIGPHVKPVLAPADVIAPAPTVTLDVPEVDQDGAPLTDLYGLEIVPDLRLLPDFQHAGSFPIVTGDDLPRLVAIVRRSMEAGEEAPEAALAFDGDYPSSPLAHYLVGLRLLDLRATGGFAAPPLKGVFGGSVVGIRADTRGGDFSLIRFDLNHTVQRGAIAGFALLRSDALYFCHDPETLRVRAPLLSLLGPCARGERLGFGGSIAEAFHDGRTGRTALRPIALYGVLNAIGNGQSPSYDGVRLLLRAGGAIEHVWTQLEGGTTIPRVGGNVIILARTAGRSLEASGSAGYRLDPTTPNDAAFESNIALRWYLLLGGNRSARLPDGVDPWGVGSLGIEGGHSYWTRPQHSFAELATPFVSAERTGTWQLLVTATLGFEGLTF